MTINLKEYQKRASIASAEKSITLLTNQPGGSLLITAPPGAGKTVIASSTVEKIIEKFDRKICFIWVAPGKLDQQSKDKIEKYSNIKCLNFKDLVQPRIDNHEMLFINWSSINKENKNTIIKENETGMYLDNVIKNTKKDDIKIVMIIDETHHTAESKRSNEIKKLIRPDLIIGVTATPHGNYHEVVKIYERQLIGEQMIREKFYINPGISGSYLSNEDILSLAIEKRKYLSHLYKQLGRDVNPLLGIQIPDKVRGKKEEKVKNEIIQHLKKEEIDTTNGKLAIHLSNEKKNTEGIDDNTSKVEVIIFKQAIALGWDCPRAQVFVAMRHMSKSSFAIQTLGRFRRVAEPNIGYYDDNELNVGYFFTNLPSESFEFTLDDKDDYLLTGQRTEKYENISLSSVYRYQYNPPNKLGRGFVSILKEKAKIYQERVDFEVNSVSVSFIEDSEINIIDNFIYDVENNNVDITKEENLQKLFDMFFESISPMNKSKIKTAIYEFFNEMEIYYEKENIKIIRIVLNEKNWPFFKAIISDSISEYKKKFGKKEANLEWKDDWEIPVYQKFPHNSSERKEVQKSIIYPFYQNNNASNIEKDFISYLEKSDKVVWWFKNGDQGNEYFGIPYIKDDVEHIFYPDFLVKLDDDSLGAFDTKAGWTAEEATEKAEALHQYIVEQNKEGKSLFGGIVILHNELFFYNDSEKYQYNEGTITPEWKPLPF